MNYNKTILPYFILFLKYASIFVPQVVYKYNISGLYLIYIIINNIKYYANPLIVKYYYNYNYFVGIIYKYNQQITNIFLTILVGISETTRTQKVLFKDIYTIILNFIFINYNILIIKYYKIIFNINNNYLSFNNYNIFKRYISNNIYHDEDIKFNQWLAGLIDGDGYLGILQSKYSTCEITVGLEDEKMLRLIQNKFGGSVKLRSGSKSIRYRLSNKAGMINLINAINGNIRHSKRLVQLHKVCNLLNITVIEPSELDINNSWISGYFDADGTINYYYQYNKTRPQLFISITNKYLVDIQPIKDVLGGQIYFDKSQNGYFKWVITNEKNHLNFYNYIQNNPSRSFKGNRLYLLPSFYKYYNNKSYIKNDSLLYKNWLLFESKWKSYNYKFK